MAFSFDELVEFWAEASIRAEARKAASMAGAGLVLAIIAPYDSSQLPLLAVRFLYWISLLLIGSLLTGPIARAWLPWAEGRGLSPVAGLVGLSVFLSVPMMPFVISGDIILTAEVHPMHHGSLNLQYALDFLAAIPAFDFITWFGQVVMITLIALGTISLINHALRQRHQAMAAAAPLGPAPGERFLNRLPPGLGRTLVCLTMEDHYLRVFTDKGDTLILMRLKDAADELADYPGFQIHRSHWVALDAVHAVRRDGRRTFLDLKTGQSLPVARTYVPALKDWGLG